MFTHENRTRRQIGAKLRQGTSLLSVPLSSVCLSLSILRLFLSFSISLYLLLSSLSISLSLSPSLFSRFLSCFLYLCHSETSLSSVSFWPSLSVSLRLFLSLSIFRLFLSFSSSLVSFSLSLLSIFFFPFFSLSLSRFLSSSFHPSFTLPVMSFSSSTCQAFHWLRFSRPNDQSDFSLPLHRAIFVANKIFALGISALLPAWKK